MPGIFLVDVSAVIGLTAMCLVSLNILMGILLSVGYDPRKQWPHRALPIPLFRLHNWTGYLALCVVLLHPTTLLLAQITPRFTIVDLLFPIYSPYQRLFNTLGAVTLYALMLVVVTSYFRSRLRRRLWKRLHYTTYVTAPVLFAHGIFIDQYLRGQTPDFLDGEKVLIECCCTIVFAAALWGWRQRWRRRIPH
jgi:predicted ferric reductase